MNPNSPYLVCFGDSLTAGYQTHPGGFGQVADTPPGEFLQQWVGDRAYVDVTGICGEVTADMVKRFPYDVVARAPQVVVILGGTNDLGWNVSPLRIGENLQHMYRQALSANIQPVGVTVPSIGMGGKEVGYTFPSETRSSGLLPEWVHAHLKARLQLNRMIEEACLTLSMTCLDLFTETAEGSAKLLAQRYSSDGLHFNTAGYEAFARLIWRHVMAEPFGEAPSGE